MLQTTVLLADINDFVAMNNVYKTFFTQREPARAAYQVSGLGFGPFTSQAPFRPN